MGNLKHFAETILQTTDCSITRTAKKHGILIFAVGGQTSNSMKVMVLKNLALYRTCMFTYEKFLYIFLAHMYRVESHR